MSRLDVTGEDAESDASATFFWPNSPYPLIEEERNAAADQRSKIQSELTFPPGLTGEIARYIYSSAPRPMIEASVIGALGLMAGVAGRCYNFSGSGLNLYMLLLAATGRGKAAMDAGVNKLVNAVRERGIFQAGEFLGPDSLASGQALARVIGENPSIVCVFGEFGYTLKALCRPDASPSDTQLMKVLLDLYNKSGKDDWLRGRMYSDRERNTKDVRSPALSIVAESTPEIFFEQITHADVSTGLLPRFMVIECTTPRPPRNQDQGCLPSESLLLGLGTLFSSSLTLRNGQLCRPVGITEAAANYLEEVERGVDRLYDRGDAIERELLNRAVQNMGRVAALLAVGCNPHNPEINMECADWAVAFVHRSISTMSQKFKTGLIGTGESRQEAELRKYVSEYFHAEPKWRRGYSTPSALLNESTLIPYGYLRRRARQSSAFSKAKLGTNRALADTLMALCQSGFLRKLDKHLVHRKFGLGADIYELVAHG